MNSLIHNSPSQGNGQPDELDGLLRRFFRAEMPQPWPACRVLNQPAQLPQTNGRRPKPTLIRSLSRFALAAAILFFFLGFLTLINMFPHSTKPLDLQHGPEMGTVPGKSMEMHHPKAGNRE